ncbi:MAG: hypothetical protein RMN24_07175 [Anaerolineae bacterium]|nr:hypothetical protein [Caldilineales bacterium]MCX7853401.1 hypothetical protein [Caldilineales bacterium]MDW8268930.1 hypothetical protein [Anaerolineae bacterium]
MAVLSLARPLWADTESGLPVGELYAMKGEWRAVLIPGSRPTVTAPAGVEWSLKCVHPLPVRPRGPGYAYPPERSGLAYEIVEATEAGKPRSEQDGWLLELRSAKPGAYRLKVDGAEITLQVAALAAPEAPTLSTAFGTYVQAEDWNDYFALFRAPTRQARADVIRRWHDILREQGMTPYQPHWWLWLLGLGTTADSGAYYNGKEFSYGNADEYLVAYGREFMVQSIGLYLRQTNPNAFAPNGVPQDQADLVAFYRAIARWQTRLGLRAWVHVDEPGIRFDTKTSLARVRRLAEAAATAGVTVGGTAWSAAALQRWAENGIRFNRYVLSHLKWNWQETPPSTVVPAGADWWFYSAAQHPAFFVGTGALPALEMVADAWRYGAKGILFWAINRLNSATDAETPDMSRVSGNNVDVWLYPDFALSLRAYHWREAISFHGLLTTVERSQGREAVAAALNLWPDVEAVRRALLVGGFEQALRKAAGDVPFVRINREAALFRAILADGFLPTSNEFDLTHAGMTYVVQRAESGSTGEVRLYYAPRGQWQPVRWIRL